MVSQEHLCERRHSDQEVQHGAAVGVVGAVMVGLDRRHGVVFADALPVLLLQILRHKEGACESAWTPSEKKRRGGTYPVVVHVTVLFLFGLHRYGFAQVPAPESERPSTEMVLRLETDSDAPFSHGRYIETRLCVCYEALRFATAEAEKRSPRVFNATDRFVFVFFSAFPHIGERPPAPDWITNGNQIIQSCAGVTSQPAVGTLASARSAVH